MDLIEKSIEIALYAYKGLKDKAGNTYILHPLRIMAKVESIDEKCVAILHDVIEDSDYTAEDLLNEGMPTSVVDAVVALTKVKGEDYDSYMERIKRNLIATKIKCIDIEDNINILRLNSISDEDLERVAKYHNAGKSIKNS